MIREQQKYKKVRNKNDFFWILSLTSRRKIIKKWLLRTSGNAVK